MSRTREKTASARAVGSIFVGREREIAELRAGLQEAVGDRGRLFLVAGEPGIGKTRLCDELAAEAETQGTQVFWGRCWEGGGAPPFWPWVQIVRAYAHGRPPETLAAQLGAGAAEVAHMVPELLAGLPDLPRSAPVEGEAARFRLFDAMTGFLKNAATAQPLALVIDDLHAADVPSLLLLQFVARELAGARLLVVATFREAELGQRPQVADLVGELARDSHRIPLRGLSVSEVGVFIQNALGSAHREGSFAGPSPAVVLAVHQASDGNPFFVDAIVRVILAEQRDGPADAPLAGLRIPGQVREAVRRHLRPLSPEARDVLTTAAVVGREFEQAVVARAHDSAAPIEDALGEAVAAGIVLERDRLRGRYGFRHALIRETLYDDLVRSRRTALHRAVGEAMEALYAADVDPHLPALAHHFVCAGRDADTQKAIHYCQRAAERDLALLAYEEASIHFARALETLTAAADHDLTLRCQLLLALGDSYNRSGAISEARATFLEASALARKLGRPEQLAEAALGFAGPDEAGVLREQEVALLEEAVSALGDQDSSLLARLMSRLVIEIYYSEYEGTRALAADAVQMARRTNDMVALAAALDAQHISLMGPYDVSKRLAVATELVQVGKMLHKSELTLRGYCGRIIDLLELSDIAQVDVEIDAHARNAADTRLPGHVYWTAVMRAMRALLDARFGEAEQLALHAFSLGQQAQEPNAGAALGVQMFVLCWHTGRLGELESGIREFVERFPRLPAWRAALALVHCELGRVREAETELQRLASGNFAAFPRDVAWLVALNNCAEVSAYLNDSRCAATLYDLLLPFAGRNLVVGDAAACGGSISHSLGLLAATMSESEQAARHFEDALATHLKMGAPALVARTEYEYGAMLLREHSPENVFRASTLLTRALDAARALGMKSLEEKIPDLLSSASAPDQYTIAITTRLESEPTTGQPADLLRKDGDYWTLAHSGAVVRLKDSKGMQYLAHLLRHPSQEFLALDLVVVGSEQSAGGSDEEGRRARSTSTAAVPILDAKAKAEYRVRLTELRDELEEAEENHDLGRSERARAELDFITSELAAAVGLNGRDRATGSDAERARSTVTKGIKSAIAKIGEAHPSAGRYLARTVRTGYFCAYVPDPDESLCWQF